MINKISKLVLLLICLTSMNVGGLLLAQDDNELYKSYLSRSFDEKSAKNYNEAGDLALEAEKKNVDSVQKANALQFAIDCYRDGNMLYKEFNAIDNMISKYRNYTNVIEQIERMFDIADAYYAGEREPAYWSLRWIPWLHGRDKTQELYTRALEKGPFAQNSHRARMRLANYLIENKKNSEALKQLREIIKIDSDDYNYRFAYLLLAEQLTFLACGSDGDGLYAQEALEVCEKFKNKYPEADENAAVDQFILKIADAKAKKLLDTAKYYHKGGKNTTAIRYANQVVTTYANTVYAEDAERLLVKMDAKYIPNSVMPEVKSRLQSYDSFSMGHEEQKMLIHPSESDNKYLLPVYELQKKEVK